MDPIFESYKETVIIEAFKSKLLTQIFKNAANKKKVAPFWDRDKADADGMVPDRNYMNVMKQQLGSMLKQLDLANVPDDAVIIKDVEDFRKKANKKQYRSVIFTDDNYMPIYYASFYDDGTINYVNVLGSHRRRGDSEPKLSHVFVDKDVTKAVVIADYDKYYNAGGDKRSERWNSKIGAIALMDTADILKSNIDKYKRLLAQKKSGDVDLSSKADDVIAAMQNVLLAYSKITLDAKSFKKYGHNKILSFINNLDKQVREINNTIENTKSSYSWSTPSKKQIDGIVRDSELWISVAKAYVENGEFDERSNNIISTLRKNQTHY